MSTYFKKVMIIDDNKIDRWLLKKIIVNTDLTKEIIEAETGVDALSILTETAKEHRKFPELIFLDMDMPVLSGMEFLAVFDDLLDQDANNARIVVTCSVYDIVEKNRVYNYNFVIGYFQKPLNEDMLMQVKSQLRHNTAS